MKSPTSSRFFWDWQWVRPCARIPFFNSKPFLSWSSAFWPSASIRQRDCVFAKFLNFLSKGRFNPLIGAAGISAFPMAARVVQKVGQEDDFENFLLMHAMGANTAGQIASVVAGGVLLALLGAH